MKALFQSKFFQDATGAPSMMRLLSFLIIVVVLLVWVGMNAVALLLGPAAGPFHLVDFGTQMVIVIGIALGGKAAQSFAEMKSEVAGLLPLRKSPLVEGGGEAGGSLDAPAFDPEVEHRV